MTTTPRRASASYAYRAVRAEGTTEFGVVEVETRDGALALLAERGLFPVEVRLEERDEAVRAEGKRRLSAADLALGLRSLATLLEAGLPMSRALAAFTDLAPPSWRYGLPAVRDAVREGKGLAAALAASPLDVPPLVIGMIQAGEAGSGLAAAVTRAAELSESAAATRAAVRSALTYPVILALAGLMSLALLVGVVLPRFAVILADLGQTLPPTTRLVLAAAAFARAALLPALIAAAMVALVWRAWTATAEGGEAWDGWLLSLPVVGNVRRAAATGRSAAALSALLHSGVPIASALLHASRASGDAALGARLRAAREAITTGHGVARAIDDAGAMTPTAVRLVRAGEETGQLAAMLGHAARVERERAAQALAQAVRLLEPAIIVAFGGLVALVAAALLQAVYTVRPT